LNLEKLNFKSEEDMMLFLDHDKAMLLFIVKAFALGELDISTERTLEIGNLIHDLS